MPNKDLEKRKKYNKEYYQKHKKEMDDHSKKWRQLNRKRSNELAQIRYQKCDKKRKEKILKGHKEYYRKHRYLIWASSTLRNHKIKGYIINLPRIDLEKMAKNTIHCPLCGCELKWNFGASHSNSPTLDRIDNEDIINKNSVWIICRQCNTTKGSRSLKEFSDYCKMIIKKIA